MEAKAGAFVYSGDGLPVGHFAYERASTKFDDLSNELHVWREVALSADFNE